MPDPAADADELWSEALNEACGPEVPIPREANSRGRGRGRGKARGALKRPAAALPARTLTAAQGFHPYRRAEDSR